MLTNLCCAILVEECPGAVSFIRSVAAHEACAGASKEVGALGALLLVRRVRARESIAVRIIVVAAALLLVRLEASDVPVAIGVVARPVTVHLARLVASYISAAVQEVVHALLTLHLVCLPRPDILAAGCEVVGASAVHLVSLPLPYVHSAARKHHRARALLLTRRIQLALTLGRAVLDLATVRIFLHGRPGQHATADLVHPRAGVTLPRLRHLCQVHLHLAYVALGERDGEQQVTIAFGSRVRHAVFECGHSSLVEHVARREIEARGGLEDDRQPCAVGHCTGGTDGTGSRLWLCAVGCAGQG
mmetsp:Transcript_89849/g.270062  ORF Transcript_89849/g.270062 Transcript_89849/m.270062 type:complete len:303 (-) Transcript_89849:867-1775(-)